MTTSRQPGGDPPSPDGSAPLSEAPAPAFPPPPPSEREGGLGGHRRRRSRTRLLVGAGIGVAVVAAAGVAAYGIGGNDGETPARTGLPPATAIVTRTTLTETERVSGTLGYGDTTQVSARGGGTITWLPAAGAVVGRGKTVYKVDDKPVPLIYGTVPLYRALTTGLEGSDVKELEQNLAALGYTGFTVDDEFSSSTATAVKEWQEDLGLDQTGRVDVSQVVVARGAIRVAELSAAIGGSAGGPVLAYSGTTRVVTVALDVALQQLVKKGIAATVTLPDGSEVAGTVASVGTVATSSGGQGQSTTTIDVVVTVADQTKLGTLDAAPVTVTLVSNRRENVLTVPVAALVALAEGGYGVQVVQNGSAQYLAVQTGMFANGRVEVTGNISEGTVVGMPK